LDVYINDFIIEGLRVSPSRNLIISKNDRFQIEPRIMDVLFMLSQNSRNVVTRKDLISRLWKVEFGGDESLTRAISILRKTFTKAGLSPKLIETIPKRGYRLATDVSKESVPHPTESVSSYSDYLGAKDIKYSKVTPTVSPTVQIASQSSVATKPMNPSKHVSKFTKAIIYSPLLLGAIFVGWYIGQKPQPQAKTSLTALPPVQEQALNVTIEAGLSDAEIAMAVLVAYDEGNISKETAIFAAERYMQKADTNDPSNVTALSTKAWLRYHQNNLNDSLAFFERAIVEDPFHGNAWLGKARVLKDRKNYELAMINADQAIRLDSLSVAPRLLKAEILAAQGLFDESSAQVDNLLKLNSQLPKAIKFRERLTVFEHFDVNKDGKISLGEIETEDNLLHSIQDEDGLDGISIDEFQVRGEASIDTSASGQTLFQYDLSDPANPKFRQWQKTK